MDEMNLVWRRSRRPVGTIAVAFTAVVGLLIVLVSQTSAVPIAGSVGNCGDFETAVRIARDGDTILQMTPQKDTGGIATTRDLRTSSGSFPLINCHSNSQRSTTISLRLIGNTFTNNIGSGSFQTEQADTGTLQISNLNTTVYLPSLLSDGGADSKRTHIIYTPSTAIFANPERGFYHYLETRAGTPTAYNLTMLQDYRLNEDITLLYCIYYLDTFQNAPISATFLTHIQSNLDTVRAAGLKCILRFAYTDEYNEGVPPFADAGKPRVLAHLDQLKPLLQENSDVIAVLQAGFIGVWGEWYYTSHFVDDPTTPGIVSSAQWQNRYEVLSKELSILPPSHTVAVRTPAHKQNTLNYTMSLGPATAYNNSEAARTGYHNDCFLASANDFGTWNTPAEKMFMADESKFVPMGGETCHLNPPRSQCPTALTELALFHYTYLNQDYHRGVLQSWKDDGCFDSVARNLGYRLQLNNGTYDNRVQPGAAFNIDVTLENVGFSAPINPRPVRLLLRHTGSGAIYAAPLPEDPRRWYAGETAVLQHAVCTSANMPTGDYELLLHLPDRAPALQARADYAIIFANGGGVQESTNGYNHLNHTLAVSGAPTAVACPADISLFPYTITAPDPTATGTSDGNNLMLMEPPEK